MADFRVTFVGNLGNLAQFNSAIRGAFASNAAALNRANSSIVTKSLGRPVQGFNTPLAQTKSSGLYIQNAKTEFDAFNNTITQSGQVVDRFISGYKTKINSIGKIVVEPIFDEAYNSSFQRATTNLRAYTEATGQLSAAEAKLLEIQRIGLTKQAFYANKAVPIQAALPSIQALQTFTSTGKGQDWIKALSPAKNNAMFQDLFKQLQQVGALGQIPIYKYTKDMGGELTGNFLNPTTANWTTLRKTIIDSGGEIKAVFAEIEADLVRTFNMISTRMGLASEQMKASTAAITSAPLYKSLQKQQDNLLGAPQGIDRQSALVLEQNAAIRNDLIKKAGLGGGAAYGTAPFFESAKTQEFAVTNVSKDISKGLTTITGQLRDANGVMSTFTYSVDKNQKVVDSWGRRLYSSGGFLNETAARLIRFTEFMVGATIVLGAFSVALTSVGKINELNSTLQRFAITAQLNDQELGKMFRDLSGIAQSTATPLLELVKAADDMALATRKANQSTDEWHKSILELAYAVGIFTNITGEDTTRATEQLVAIMKQLNLETSQLIPLLSQITAAAGGQAGSITDIAQALSTLAEAGQEAQVSVTQQIAAAQVISLATGKTADQTAVAFKNLFGAINADSAVKKLQEFGISVRDINGDLRPFLTIYSEIQEAINKGVIPKGRVNEVLRAISGGPRRSPDAAALLANINKVFEVERIATGATNESLVANAQILSTNRAKITQFQAAWDTSLYEKLNKTLEDLTATLAQLGTTFAKIFGAIDPGIISLTTHLIGFYAAFSLISKLSGSIGLTSLFKNIGQGLGLVKASAKDATIAVKELAAIDTRNAIYGQVNSKGVTQYKYLSGGFASSADVSKYTRELAAVRSISTPQPFRVDKSGDFQYVRGGGYVPQSVYGPMVREVEKAITVGMDKGSTTFTGRLKEFFSSSGFKGAIGGGLTGGLIGGISTLATGGSPLEAAANASQFGAFGALMAGGPVGLAAGATLGVLSVVLGKFVEQEENVKKKSSELELSLYNLTEQWKVDQASVQAAQDTYKEIKDNLQTTKEGTDEYKDLQFKLGEALVDVTTAVDHQKESLQNLLKVLQELADFQPDKPSWGIFVKDILSQGLDEESLRNLQGKLSELLLSATGQAPYSSKLPVAFDASKLNYSPVENVPVYRKGVLTTETSNNVLYRGKEFSATDLLNSSSLIKDILNSTGSDAASIPFNNPEVISAFRAGMADLLKSGQINQETVDRFELAVNRFSSAPTQIAQSITSYKIGATTGNQLGYTSLEEFNNAQLRAKIAERLQSQFAQDFATRQKETAPGFVGPVSVSEESLKALANEINSLLVDVNGKPNYSELPTGQLRGLAVQDLTNQVPNFSTLSIDEQNGAIAKWAANLGLTDEKIKAIINDVRVLGASSAEVDKIKQATQDWADQSLQGVGQKLLELQARLQGGEFQGNLSGYKELYDQLKAEEKAIYDVLAASKDLESQMGNNTSAAAKILLDNLNNLGVNGFQGIEANIDSLNTALFGFINTMNLSGEQIAKVVYLWSKAISLAQQIAQLPSGLTGLSGAIVNPIRAALLAQLQNLVKEFNRIGGQGSGTKTNTTIPKTTASGPSTDTLYLSEEQRKVADPLALVKQAYADALKLQSQIPGETSANKNNTVIVFDELQKIFSARGVSEELLRRALDNLTTAVNEANAKADTVRRIRVGAGDFSAIANVPLNSQTGVSVAGSNQINITFNLGGTNLTPAQFNLFANQIASEIARRL